VECYTAANTATAIAAISSNSFNRAILNLSTISDNKSSLSGKDDSTYINRLDSDLNSVTSTLCSSPSKNSPTSEKRKLSFLVRGINSKSKRGVEGEKKAPLRGGTIDSYSKQYQEVAASSGNASPTKAVPTVSYDHDSFLKTQKDPFLKQLLETQMFASFEEECLVAPNTFKQEKSNEVIFFEESILAKKNRSALSYKVRGERVRVRWLEVRVPLFLL
jgi:hypothetical protein